MCGRGQSSPSKAVACADCPIGKYNGDPGTLCNRCRAGLYTGTEGQLFCRGCEPAYYCPSGSNHRPCSVGTYGPELNQFKCINCDAGKYTTLQILSNPYAVCEDCEPTKYSTVKSGGQPQSHRPLAAARRGADRGRGGRRVLLELPVRLRLPGRLGQAAARRPPVRRQTATLCPASRVRLALG